MWYQKQNLFAEFFYFGKNFIENVVVGVIHTYIVSKDEWKANEESGIAMRIL